MTEAPLLVLVEPQDLVNIATAIRVAKNFAIDRVRLVSPREYDAWRIEGIAHNTADVLDKLVIVDTLEQALDDVVWAVALTARERRAKRTVLRPRAAAQGLVERAGAGPVAFVVGREDKGLTNEELDRCHALVTIPTNPDHRSLNLGHAVAIMAWECWMARQDPPALKGPRHLADPATGGHYERLFHDWEHALAAIDFFKTRQPDAVLRAFREIMYRAEPDGREATLLRAMALEIVRYLQRQGLPVPADPNAPGGQT